MVFMSKVKTLHSRHFSKVGLYQVLANYTIPILYWWKNLLYYTIPIPILYQFLGGFVHGFMFSAWDKPLQKCKGNQNFVMSSPSLWPPTPPLHSTLDQLFLVTPPLRDWFLPSPPPHLSLSKGEGPKTKVQNLSNLNTSNISLIL